MKKLFLLSLFGCLLPAAYGQYSLEASFHQSEMDGTKTIQLQVMSPDTLHDETLVISCSKTLEIYVATDSMVDTTDAHLTSIRFRTEEQKPSKQAWNVSTDMTAAFASHPKDFLASIRHSEKLFFEFTPYQGVPRTVSFDISGLDAQLSKYYECRHLVN